MIAALPWVGLFLALVLFVLEKHDESQPKTSKIAAPIAYLCGAAGLIAIGLWQGFLSPRLDLIVVAGLLSVVFAVVKPASLYSHIGLACVACSAGSFTMHTDFMPNPFWIAVVTGLAAACGAWAARSTGSIVFGVVATSAALLNRWTSPEFGILESTAGSLLTLAAATTAIIVVLLFQSKNFRLANAAKFFGVVLLIAAGFGLVRWGGRNLEETVIVVAGALLAASVTWMYPEKENANPSKAVLAGLIWMGAATYAFSVDSSFGLALLLTTGVLGFAMMGTPKLTATLSPVFALVAFKTIRDDFPEMTRAFDIAQHYSMIGVMVGVGIIMVAAEWAGRVSDRPSLFRLLAFGVVGLTMATTVLFSLVFFGEKGGIGLVVGLGMASWFMVAVGKSYGGAMTASVGLVGIVGLGYPHMSNFFDYSRQEKMTAFLIAAGVLTVITLLVSLLSGKADQPTVSQANENQ